MKKSSEGGINRDAGAGKFVVGHARFAKISAVEGLELTDAMKARKARFERAGASAAERREAIIKAHKR